MTRRLLALTALTALAVLAALVFAVAAAAHAARGPVVYASLGDSIASGHGLHDRGDDCRRSSRAYPLGVLSALRARRGDVRYRQLACSGATATGDAAEGLESLRGQVDALLRTPLRHRTLVSLTIGINDFRWADVVSTYLRLRDPDESAYEAWVEGTTAGVAAAVRPQLRRLLARPGVAVVLTDYPNPVNAGSLLFAGPQPCADPTACYARTELLVHRLDAALAGLAAGRARVRFASVLAAFRGHEAPEPECGDAPPLVERTWFQYPSDPDSNSFPGVPAGFGVWRGDCFHPNAAGAAAYAAAVIREARRLGF